MKKWILTILVLTGLLLLVGCGKTKQLTPCDDDSLYPYGWEQNADGSLTLEIQGEWDEDCAWQVDYDTDVLAVEQEEKTGRYIIRGLLSDATSVDFTLHRNGGEEKEYGIWLFVNVGSDGSVNVLEYTHEEPFIEGEYTCVNEQDGSLLLCIYTEHDWDYRLLQTQFTMEKIEAADNSVTYQIRASEAGNANLELWDTESGDKLTVYLYSEDGRTVEAGNIQKGIASETIDAVTLDLFWQELDIDGGLLPQAKVTDCKVVTGDREADFTYGKLILSIGGMDYEYCAANDAGLLERYALQTVIEDGVVVAQATTGMAPLPDGSYAATYSREDAVSATWEKDGTYFALYSEDASPEELTAALGQIAGESNG